MSQPTITEFVWDYVIGKRLSSPRREASIAKGVPMHYLPLVREYHSKRGERIAVRYRGPRRPGQLGQQTCLKEDATSFSVYHRA